MMNQADLLFLRYPWDDSHEIREKMCDPEKGPHMLLRTVKSPTRARFAQLLDHAEIPQVLLFGSPHLDNYTRTDSGVGLIDFDRSYRGPFAWDLACFILSLSLRKKKKLFQLPKEEVLSTLFTSYREGLTLDRPFAEYRPLAERKRKPWQENIDAYIASGKKWAKKLVEQAVPATDPLMRELKNQYFENLHRKLSPHSYTIEAAARALGSLGRVHNLMLVRHEDGSRQLIDVKHTRSYLDPHWEHNRYYGTEHIHDGLRMIEASHLHAPGITEGESWATVNGVQYWGRKVPLLNVKVKGLLSKEEQLQLSRAVGEQLGKSHGQSGNVAKITAYLEGNEKQLTEACAVILQEMERAWTYYLSMASREPAYEG